jgi:hypothetical protein
MPHRDVNMPLAASQVQQLASMEPVRGLKARQAQALQGKKSGEPLTGSGEMSSTRAIRADVGLAVSGRLVLKFVPNKVQQSTLIRIAARMMLPFGRVLCFFGSSAARRIDPDLAHDFNMLGRRRQVRVPRKGMENRIKGMVKCLP